ncbi:unnamed protein product [Discula destructiva]
MASTRPSTSHDMMRQVDMIDQDTEICSTIFLEKIMTYIRAVDDEAVRVAQRSDFLRLLALLRVEEGVYRPAVAEELLNWLRQAQTHWDADAISDFELLLHKLKKQATETKRRKEEDRAKIHEKERIKIKSQTKISNDYILVGKGEKLTDCDIL